jgi:hypothetical protein
MKKITLFFIAILFITLNISAQSQQIIVGQNYVYPNEITLVAERGVSTTIKFDLNELDLIEVETNYGLASKISSANATVMLEAGSPELFYLPTAIIIPDLGSAELQISHGGYTEFGNIEIAPSKGNFSRQIDPATVPYWKGEVYYEDAFFPGTLANINETFTMRDYRGQSIFVYPVQYNPVTKILRVYSEITVTVNYTENSGENEFTTQKRHTTVDPAFSEIYHNFFLNYGSHSRAHPTEEAGELLIICHTAFMDEMKPYIDWKRTIGRETTIVPTSETGTTAAQIKTYIQNYYNNPDKNLAYVLFVGDNPQIPAHATSNGIRSDVVYAQLASTPYLDILVGRMSAETIAQVQTQVQRSIHYERDLTTSDTWLTTAIGIGANENNMGPIYGGHDGSENDYVHIENIRTRLLANGYTTVWQDYFANCPGYTNSSSALISQHVNDGTSMINYCNHGSPTAWTIFGGPSWGVNQINALTNVDKLPFVFSVACNNGEFGYFQNNTSNVPCFAEVWMRATQGNQPKGAISIFGATISISWQPPMTAQDEFVNLCLGITHTAGGFNYGLPGRTIRTIAGAMLNASQRMIMRHGTNPCNPSTQGCARNDYDSWLVFGDPTLQFRTKTPQEMTISHLPSILSGVRDFSVECDANGAVAAITYKDENDEVIILGVGTVVDGVAEITFDEPLTTTGELTLAVMGFNKIAYLTTLHTGENIELFPPKDLTGKVEKANHVVLNWEAPEENEIMPVKGYNIFRNEELITQEPVRDEITFTDIVPQNDTYTYHVTALYNLSGSLASESSNTITVTIDGMCVPFTKKITLAEMTENSILISWNAPEYDGVELAGYNVFRDDEQINEEIIPANELSFLDDELVLGTQYCYHVEVVYNDCEAAIKSEKDCASVSVYDFPGIQTFNIFPNPTSGNITIEGAGLCRIEIYDLQGRILLEQKAESGKQNKIDVSNFQTGVYLVKMYSETNESAVKRLVLVK